MDAISDILKFMWERGKVTDAIGNNSLNFQQSFNQNVDKIANEMLKTITDMPTLSSIKGFMPVFNVVRSVAYSCVGCIVCYKGLRMLFSPDDLEKEEGKRLFGRLAYSFVFGSLSIKFIDGMIMFNNLLIDLLTSKFSILPMMASLNKSYGIVLSIIFLIAELFVCIKILIGFWMRMAELVFAGTISPAMYVLWINKEWSGHLKSWWRRVSILVFTQISQVILLVLYTMLINGLVLSGTLSGVCLTIGMLFMVDTTPKMLQGFMDGTSIQTAERTVGKVLRVKTKVGRFIEKFGKE